MYDLARKQANNRTKFGDIFTIILFYLVLQIPSPLAMCVKPYLNRIHIPLNV